MAARIIIGTGQGHSAALRDAAKPYNGWLRTMLSLPNLLTLSRILAVPILVFLLWRPAPLDYAITFALYCLVGITDYFDGYLARAWGSISRLGQFLDPIADKIMVGAVLVMLISSRKANPVPEIAGLHIIAALIILLREIIVSGLREYLAGAPGIGAGQRAGQMEDDDSAGRAWSADPGRRGAAHALGARGRHYFPVGGSGADPDHRLFVPAHRPSAHGLICGSTDRFAVITDEL